MKTIIVISLLLCAGVLTAVNSYYSPVTNEIVLMRDITDSLLAQPDSEEIYSLYNFNDENKWNGAIFRYSTLSDVNYNDIFEIKIAAVNKWLSNEPERDKEIKKFETGLSEIVTKKDSIGKNHSSVYLPLAQELKRLSESQSQKRIAIIYSDLMENGLDISLYDKKEFALFKSNPDSLRMLFENRRPLPDLSGIEIYIVYHPSDVTRDAEFKVVSEFYRQMLEQKGARVIVSANLSI